MTTTRNTSIPIEIQSDIELQTDSLNNNHLTAAVEWLNDNEFLSPNDMYTKASNLYHCLIAKHLIDTSFTTLYRQGLKNGWINIFEKERKSLKPNINSTAKCFMLNRLITENKHKSIQFVRQTAELYEEIKSRMHTVDTLNWTFDYFNTQVYRRQNLQCQRRLFYTKYEDDERLCNLLTLQAAVTQLYPQILNICQQNYSNENNSILTKFLQHCFIIVQQPSISECVAAVKYKKSNNKYTAKISARIICLIDPNSIGFDFGLSNVAVKLRPFDRQIDDEGEDQIPLEWQKRIVVDTNENSKSILFVELKTINLQKTDLRNSRPTYRANLCLLEFSVNIQIKPFGIEKKITLISQLFGICSHAQYFSEFVAKVLIHEVDQLTQSNSSIIQPDILADYINRYHIHRSGVEMNAQTFQFIKDLLQKIHDQQHQTSNINSFTIYESIVARLVCQMELYVDYPFLSMMYQDGLFLGICDQALDQQLCGTYEYPHILIRMNSITRQQSNQNASVRFIVHNGKLIGATFHPKAFIDEMCRMICEANSERAKNIRLLPLNQSFYNFSWYFDKELYRLNSATAPLESPCQPLIPILWNTMRINTDLQEQISPLTNPIESLELKRSRSTDTLDIDEPKKLRKISDEESTSSTEMKVHQAIDKFFDYLSHPFIPAAHIITTTCSPSIVLSGDIEQHKNVLHHLIMDALPRTTLTSDAIQAPLTIPDDFFPFLDDGNF